MYLARVLIFLSLKCFIGNPQEPVQCYHITSTSTDSHSQGAYTFPHSRLPSERPAHHRWSQVDLPWILLDIPPCHYYSILECREGNPIHVTVPEAQSDSATIDTPKNRRWSVWWKQMEYALQQRRVTRTGIKNSWLRSFNMCYCQAYECLYCRAFPQGSSMI
jgi:hypothetical protein